MLIANRRLLSVQFCNHINSATKEDKLKLFRQLHQKNQSAVLSWSIMAELLHLAPKKIREQNVSPQRHCYPRPYQLLMLTAIWYDASLFTHLMPLTSFRRSNILHISSACRLWYKIFKEAWENPPFFHHIVIVSCTSYLVFIKRQLEHTLTRIECSHWRRPDCVTIGECGLDYSARLLNLRKQQAVFCRQIK